MRNFVTAFVLIKKKRLDIPDFSIIMYMVVDRYYFCCSLVSSSFFLRIWHILIKKNLNFFIVRFTDFSYNSHELFNKMHRICHLWCLSYRIDHTHIASIIKTDRTLISSSMTSPSGNSKLDIRDTTSCALSDFMIIDRSGWKLDGEPTLKLISSIVTIWPLTIFCRSLNVFKLWATPFLLKIPEVTNLSIAILPKLSRSSISRHILSGTTAKVARLNISFYRCSDLLKIFYWWI